MLLVNKLCLCLSVSFEFRGRGVRRIFAKGGQFWCPGGGKNFDPLFFSSDFDHFNANFWNFALFLGIFRIQGGQILPPLAPPGGGILNKYFSRGGHLPPPGCMCGRPCHRCERREIWKHFHFLQKSMNQSLLLVYPLIACIKLHNPLY